MRCWRTRTHHAPIHNHSFIHLFLALNSKSMLQKYSKWPNLFVRFGNGAVILRLSDYALTWLLIEQFRGRKVIQNRHWFYGFGHSARLAKGTHSTFDSTTMKLISILSAASGTRRRHFISLHYITLIHASRELEGDRERERYLIHHVSKSANKMSTKWNENQI